MTVRQNWDLESIFAGGSDSAHYATYLENLQSDIRDFLAAVSIPEAGVKECAAALKRVQAITNRMRHASAFVGCLAAQNVKDGKAKLLGGKVRAIGAGLASVLTNIDKHLLLLDEGAWQLLLADPELTPLKFNLEERRRRAKEKMPAAQETLVNDLSVDGYHGWSSLYDTVVGRMTIPIEQDGNTMLVSPGQAANMMASPDRAFRSHVFARWEETWAKEADFCALALNNLAGFRLNLYRHRHWEDVLYEPLDYNRMEPETLNAMWTTINNNKPRLTAYLARKKKQLGAGTLSWHDVTAPSTTSGGKMPFEQAADFIVQQFRQVDPYMADFTAACFAKGWVEAEDRPGKRPGAFCTTFPEMKESRVFMTYSGTMNNVATLAHELGHAFHQAVMNDLPPMAQQYAMNVAETASTFAEVIVADAAVAQAKDRTEKIALIEDKLERAVTLLMNIQCRFLFETRFYAERKAGPVSKERLCELMVEAQKEAFANSLDEYHPHFWAAKLHFFNTGVPFYNFPYTFGYLFATGVYSQAAKEGPAFAAKYVALLRDTGSMKVEDLAQRHLNVDLSQTGFWQDAIDSALAELDEYLALTAAK